MRKNLILIFLLLISLGSFAQRQPTATSQKPKKEKEKDGKTAEDYKMSAWGATINTNSGVLGGFVYRSSKSIGNWGIHPVRRYFAIEAINLKHPKEKTDNQFSRVIYNKINYFFIIRPEYGREVMLFPKSGEEGIGTSAIFAVGPSIGIEKPYYIKYQPNQGNGNDVQTVPFDPAIHTDFSKIVGTGSFFQGLFSSNIVPGIHVKVAINLDVNTFGKSLTGFEIGWTGEFFTRSPDIVAFAENKQFYTSAYFTLYFGSKK